MNRPRGKPFQKGRAKSGGRKPGTPNKLTTDVRAAILGAFNKLGGEDWLVRLARRDPKSFATLLGKLVPTHDVSSSGAQDPDELARRVRERLRFMEQQTAGSENAPS